MNRVQQRNLYPQILLDAAALVERGHAKKAVALDEAGLPVSALSRNAVKFCPVGAITRSVLANFAPAMPRTMGRTRLLDSMRDTEGRIQRIIKSVARLERVPGFSGFLHEWNDHEERQASEVADLLLKAAEYIEAREAAPAPGAADRA